MPNKIPPIRKSIVLDNLNFYLMYKLMSKAKMYVTKNRGIGMISLNNSLSFMCFFTYMFQFIIILVIIPNMLPKNNPAALFIRKCVPISKIKKQKTCTKIHKCRKNSKILK